jgi:hypothetical protein
MQRLEADGKLPIRAQWFYWFYDRPQADGNGALIDAIDLSIDREGRLRPLRQELAQRGYFDWRTWSMKDNAEPGYWEVRLVFADGSEVPCARGMPTCHFVIEVKGGR